MDAALSRREREVAELVAEGLTNREIAERLVIAERTAEGHVEQIRNKLGFRSRTQIAGWVVEQRRSGATTAPPAPPTTSAIALEPVRPIRFHGPGLRRAMWVVAAGLTALVVVTAVAVWPHTAAAMTLELVAGIGTRGFSGDGGPATAAQISDPTSIAFDREGALMFADSFREGGVTIPAGDLGNRTRVRRIETSGVIRTVVGDLSPPRAFNIAELGRQLALPPEARIAVGPDHALYIAGSFGAPANFIGRVDEAGRWAWLAGGAAALTAELAPERRTTLLGPAGLAISGDGVIYVANIGTSQILAIPPTGDARAVAGTGKRGASGDGGPATAATFYAPPAIRLSLDGGIYIVDTYNHRVRAIDHGGIVRTVAGTGARGFSGDGGPAAQAQLAFPTDVAFGLDGTMYIADLGNARVRAVAPDGTITTVAGPTGLTRPNALAIGANGTLYIGDGGAHKILRLVRKG